MREFAKLFQLCLTLCDPVDHGPPGSSVHRILQARILERVAMPPSGDLPNPGLDLLRWETGSSPLASPGKLPWWSPLDSFYDLSLIMPFPPFWNVHVMPAAASAKSLQSCPTLCDLIDGSPPGSPVPGILQARTGKNTGVGCHFLLQCMKVKSESEVTQSSLR